VPEKGYLRAVLGLGSRGAHAKQHLPLDERVALRARLYRRSLAATGIIWCAALVLDHAPPAASGLVSTTPNSVLVAASAAEGGSTGPRASVVASTEAADLAAPVGPAAPAGPVAPATPAVPSVRYVGPLAAEAAEARSADSVGNEPVFLAVAAASCPGLPWQVLGAIAQVETGGGHVEISSAGAVGPMQLLPSTWLRYRPDQSASIDDFQDSAVAAARLLCANGAPANLRRALWNYNHSDFYVDKVLQLAAGMGAPV
jgi:hypothetical protein